MPSATPDKESGNDFMSAKIRFLSDETESWSIRTD
jgi:hypothetical protein